MTATFDDSACGFYGKLPARGDFVTRRLPPGFVEAWDEWLQSGMTDSRERLGEDWLDAYLVAPVWRFVIAAGLLDQAAIAGVLMPSVDKVGRYFPLTIAAVLEATVSPAGLAAEAGDWFANAEALGMAVLEEELDFERFDEGVAALGAPASPSSRPDPIARDDGAWVLPLDPDGTAGSALARIAGEVLDDSLGAYSVWWTTGSDFVAPSLLLRRGRSTFEDFPALIDGLWLTAPEAAPWSDVEETP